MHNPDLSTIAIALAGAVLGALLWARVERCMRARRGREVNLRGKRGEVDAERVLRDHGYTIAARQHRTRYRITVDGVTRDVTLLLDFVVERHGEQWVAEVKTGNAADLTRETRRQLLEYQLATGGHSVLLVDPEASTITQVAFPLPEPSPQRTTSGAPMWLVATLTGFILFCLWRALER